MSERFKKTLRALVALTVVLSLLCTGVWARKAAFTDISGHWAEPAIEEAARCGLAQGYDDLYRPDDSMTRAELVTILWRAMGQPRPEKEASFTDLTQDWYRDAVAWAEAQAVINGMGDGRFAPDDSVTREQLAAVLYRLSGGKMGMESLFISIYDDYFTDDETISSYAKSAVYWCVFHVVYCGEASEEVGEILAPQADATRGQVAVMLIRYLDRNL